MIVVDEYIAVRVLRGRWPTGLPDDEDLALSASAHWRLLQAVHTGARTPSGHGRARRGSRSPKGPGGSVLSCPPPPSKPRAGRCRLEDWSAVSFTPARRTNACEARPAAGRMFVALAAIITMIVVGLMSLIVMPASASPLAGAGKRRRGLRPSGRAACRAPRDHSRWSASAKSA